MKHYKHNIFLLLCLAILNLVVSCTADDELDFQIEDQVKEITGRELPKNLTSLKVLCIGNSFSEDALLLLPDLLKSAGIDNVMFGFVNLGGASLERHLINFNYQSPSYVFYAQNKDYKWNTHKPFSIQDALDYDDWDLIVLQQVSQLSGRYETYQPYLNQLIESIDDYCSGQNPVFAWHMTWAYATGYNNSDFSYYNYNQQEMYNDIVNAVKTMQLETGIKLIIPSGTAIQNLRATPLNNPPMDLTRDGRHIVLGAGRYTLSCTWFQSLIKPCFNIDVTGNAARANQGMRVTDDNYETCQKAAVQAFENPFIAIK